MSSTVDDTRINGAAAGSITLGRVLIAGSLSGVLSVLFALSYASVLFSGPLAPYLSIGVGMALFGAVTIGLAVALTSTHAGTIGGVASEIAVLGLVTRGVSADPRLSDSPDAMIATVVTGLTIASLITAATFLLLGTARVGRLIRYIPYPVMGGFVGGIGWLLIHGAFDTTAGVSLGPGTLVELGSADLVTRWAPALLAGLGLYLIARRQEGFLGVPIVLAALGVGFYAIAALTGTGLDVLRDGGWLVGPLSESVQWTPGRIVDGLDRVRWDVLLGIAPEIVTFTVIMTLGTLLSGTALELSLRRDVNLDRELRAAGGGMLVSGLGGGFPGYQYIGCTTLNARLGASFRATALVSTLVCVVALVYGAGFLALLPRVIAGALLFFMGFNFVAVWLYDSYSRLARADYLIVVLVFLVVVVVGFMEGVGVGVIAGLGLFAYNYSRVDVVKRSFSAAGMHSRASRAEAVLQRLREEGGEIRILTLEGFIFFGTINGLVERIRAMTEETDAPDIRTVILDFRAVSGLDSSAALHFGRLTRLARNAGFDLVLSALRDEVQGLLEREGFRREHRTRNVGDPGSRERRYRLPNEQDEERVRIFADLDHALEWAEQMFLYRRGLGDAPTDVLLEDYLLEHFGGANAVRLFVSYASVETIRAGQTLIEQGDLSDSIHFIVSGSTRVVLETAGGEMIRLGRSGPGTAVGEVALYLGQPRTASVIADEMTSVLTFTRKALEDMERSDPALYANFHKMMATLLARRLANNSVLIDDLMK